MGNCCSEETNGLSKWTATKDKPEKKYRKVSNENFTRHEAKEQDLSSNRAIENTSHYGLSEIEEVESDHEQYKSSERSAGDGDLKIVSGNSSRVNKPR